MFFYALISGLENHCCPVEVVRFLASLGIFKLGRFEMFTGHQYLKIKL